MKGTKSKKNNETITQEPAKEPIIQTQDYNSQDYNFNEDYDSSQDYNSNENYNLHKDNLSENYSSHFSNNSFWKKIAKHYSSAGMKLVENALVLYHSLRDKDTPKWAKTIILGALGYFILPVDAIPDFVPIVGFTDDIATIFVAFATVALFIKKEHREKAKQIIAKIFNK